MAIFQITPESVGDVDVVPHRVRMFCNNTLAEVSAVNFLHNAPLNDWSPRSTDIVQVLYGNLQYGEFQPVITPTTITLVPISYPGSVQLPVVNGNLAMFFGIGGTISDSGISAASIGNDISPNYAANPVAPVKGQRYFNTVSNQFLGWNGAAWVILG